MPTSNVNPAWVDPLYSVAPNHFVPASRIEVPHANRRPRRRTIFIQSMSKRRRGYPSEANVGRGTRIVHGDKLLEEKLGRNDLCPCGSGRRFKKCCLKSGRF
jgi:hypothetical protein